MGRQSSKKFFFHGKWKKEQKNFKELAMPVGTALNLVVVFLDRLSENLERLFFYESCKGMYNYYAHL